MPLDRRDGGEELLEIYWITSEALRLCRFRVKATGVWLGVTLPVSGNSIAILPLAKHGDRAIDDAAD
jgi:hypothetical protein